MLYLLIYVNSFLYRQQNLCFEGYIDLTNPIRVNIYRYYAGYYDTMG